MRPRFFLLKLLEDAALASLRGSPAGARAPAIHALLFFTHRRALAAIGRLPPAPIAAGRLGLHHQSTRVVTYDPAWAQRYAAEEALLRDFLGEACGPIHHIGSTAVPGLPSKPIIDIAIGLPETGYAAELSRAIPILTKLGYRYMGNRGHRGGHYLEKVCSSVRTHAIQLHPVDSSDLRRLLRFRDLLRSDAGIARRYAEAKASLAKAVGADRRVYVWYKSHWIDELFLGQHERQAWGRRLLRQDSPTLWQMYLRRRPAG
jgi:GrpB-like predicted nucleotidyltransferase (UPF0157 family)